ncbi:tryptophan--tRNA ligase, partial [Candidatus Roizmanbacteria bacterium CG10_big_fil_rev_8_21_14_0_10_45_7]
MATIFSGIQPSAQAPHIGNYIGALKQWIELQSGNDALYCVVDLHALTVPQDPNKLHESIDQTYALLLSIGLDPEKSTVFVQSHVPAHAQLGWVLQTISTMGELSRMTQFKDKSAKFKDSIPSGLFTYPTLMAADIVLYDTQIVPVGEDQIQHVELARNLAQRFNNRFGETFVVPHVQIKKEGARIMSLSDPTKKMSKSDENKHAAVFLNDTPDMIAEKFARAVTDSQTEIIFDPARNGLYNLLLIYKILTGKSEMEIEQECAGKGYKEF